MKKTIQILSSLILMLFLTLSFASSTGQVNSDKKSKIQVDLFLTTTCPHCQKADLFFQDLEKKGNLPIQVNRFYINQDKAALKQFYGALKAQGINDFSVPSIFFCDSRWAGFDTAATTGKKLLTALQYCQQQIKQSGQLTPLTVRTLRQWANADRMEESIQPFETTRSFLPLIALSQAMSPCSLFLILAFLSFIALAPSLSGKAIIASVFLGGLILMNATEQWFPYLFNQLPMSLRGLSVGIGLGLLIVLVQVQLRRVWSSQSLVVGVMALLSALILQVYQQNCIPNYALIFAHWLSGQTLSTFWKSAYILHYQLVYLVPLLVYAALLIGFGHYKLARYKGVINDIATLVLGVSALLFILYPETLSNANYALVTLVFAFFSAFAHHHLIKKE